ncbi:MAG: HAD-IA family hydrolase [Inquilinus sp.]|nr:HAD-IA family hydrolase [Inquilinus sp.]
MSKQESRKGVNAFPNPRSEAPMELILFDCDGVLVDSEIIACRILADLIGEYVPAMDRKRYASAIFGSTDDQIVAAAEAEYGVRFPADFVETAAETIKAALEREVEATDGADRALQTIDLPKGVVSNSPRDRVDRMLDRAGLGRHFGGDIFCAEMVARPKPSPDVYLLAAKRLNAAPTHCLAVEDSVAGATAALAAGMTVIGYLGGRHIPVGHGDRMRALGVVTLVPHMDDLAAAIADLSQGGQRVR